MVGQEPQLDYGIVFHAVVGHEFPHLTAQLRNLGHGPTRVCSEHGWRHRVASRNSRIKPRQQVQEPDSQERVGGEYREGDIDFRNSSQSKPNQRLSTGIFRFASPISTRVVDETASLGKVLARSWSTVFRRRREGPVSRLAPTQGPGMPFFQPDSQTLPLLPDTLRHGNRLCLTLYLSRWRRQRRDPPQHASEEPARQTTGNQ